MDMDAEEWEDVWMRQLSPDLRFFDKRISLLSRYQLS